MIEKLQELKEVRLIRLAVRESYKVDATYQEKLKEEINAIDVVISILKGVNEP